ncbi:MAG: cell division topological specificity factor MinE [Desulfobacteraceae bacterium 4572_35.1]|nr:MAG: cell division topological specificity factor MinE [Desulfobacteraceae bacterium 4572_35.1]
MKFFDFFRSSNCNTASVAKERLQIIVAHERNHAASLDFLPQLQQDILRVVRNYISIDEEQVKLSLDSSGDVEVLELNISLSDQDG